MKVGDLVRLKSAYPYLAPLGLLVSIEYHNVGFKTPRVRVRWFRGSFAEYCYMSNLEVISESR